MASETTHTTTVDEEDGRTDGREIKKRSEREADRRNQPNRGAYAVVDPHNFGRYYEEVISDTAGFGAWWSKVAARYADNELVIFDTNNEYHDMDNALVGQLNQAAIDAIRAAGATSQYIFVEGNSWSGAWHWVRNPLPPLPTPPLSGHLFVL